MFIELMKFLGTAAISITALAWLTRKIISHFLEKDIERFKNEIRLRNDFELESLKSRLQTESSLLKIRFTDLHAKRAEIVKELFNKLNSLIDAMEKLAYIIDTPIIEPVDDLANKYIDIYFDFHNYFKMHEIYFSQEFTNLIKSLHSDIFETSLTAAYEVTSDNLPQFQKFFKSEYTRMKENSDKARSVIMSEFRMLLGVTG